MTMSDPIREALESLVKAWEALPAGNYSGEAGFARIRNWLSLQMKPAVDGARQALSLLTTKASALCKLAEQCERAFGPSFELDRELADGCWNGDVEVSAFSYSVDAALLLVDRPVWNVGHSRRMAKGFFSAVVGHYRGTGRTPALALCAAALRSRAASAMSAGTAETRSGSGLQPASAVPPQAADAQTPPNEHTKGDH
jgi:hypothetical protein